MWIWLLLAGVRGVLVSITPQKFPGETWEVGGQAVLGTDTLLLNPQTANSKGFLRSKEVQSIDTMEMSLTFVSSCSRTQNSQGMVILLTTDPLQPGPLLGVQDRFHGALISINHKGDEIGLFFSDGKKPVGEGEAALKCQYTNPLVKNSIHISLARSRMTVYSGLDRRLCGTLHFPLAKFYIGVNSMALAQPCTNTIYSLTIETPDTDKIQSLDRSMGEMDEEFADVIGEIKDLVDDFSGKKPGGLAYILKETSRNIETLQKELKRLRDSFDSQLKRNEWLLSTLTSDLDTKHRPMSSSIKDLTSRVEKGELAEKLSKWVDMYTRRTLTTEPELTQTLKEIKEQTEKVETYVRKEDKFVWVYVLLFGLLVASLIVYRRLRQVTKLHDN